MAKKAEGKGRAGSPLPAASQSKDGAHGVMRPTNKLKSSSLLDTRVIYCGDNLEKLAKLPDACVDLIYPALAGRPRCVQLAASSKRPAAFITTATGTPATTSGSCSTRFWEKIIKQKEINDSANFCQFYNQRLTTRSAMQFAN